MKTTIIAIKFFLCMTVLTGIVYPLAVLGYAQALCNSKANGSIINAKGQAVGSELIGQNFSAQRYFIGRPSAVSYTALPSGGSNLSPTSAQLRAAVNERQTSFGGGNVPADLLFASASGLDPHISPEAALMQCARIAAAYGVGQADIISLVDSMTEPEQAGFFGEPRVNVLMLNLKLDEMYFK